MNEPRDSGVPPTSPATPARRGPDYTGESGWNAGWSGPRTDSQPTYSQPAGPPADQQAYGYGGYHEGQGSWPAPGAPESTSVLTMPAPAPTPAPRKRRTGVLAGAFVLSALIGAGAGVGSYALADRTVGGGAVTSPISVTTVPAAKSPVLDGTVSAAVAKIQPSVVTITVRAGQSGDIGTGVVVDDQGHVLTNYHVVSAAVRGGGNTAITVTLANGTTTTATVVGYSSPNDLAVIKVADTANLTPAVFAKSSSLVDGQTVVAAGAPLGLSETYTSGIVSNTARPVRSGTDNDAVYLALQTDAAINPGNSGGPLVNLNGDIVGINSSIASTGSADEAGNIGIGFSIPSDVASRVAADLIASGKSPIAAMGVTVGGASSDPSSTTTATGVTLQTVSAGGAAANAGLQQGDVITKVNGFDTTSADGLIAATRFYPPNTTIDVTYARGGGQAQTVKVTLGTL